MTPTERDPIPQPTDQAGNNVPGTDVSPSADADTEGHSLLNIELAGTLSRDRARETAKLDQDSARARAAEGTDPGGFFKRLGRR